MSRCKLVSQPIHPLLMDWILWFSQRLFHISWCSILTHIIILFNCVLRNLKLKLLATWRKWWYPCGQYYLIFGSAMVDNIQWCQQGIINMPLCCVTYCLIDHKTPACSTMPNANETTWFSPYPTLMQKRVYLCIINLLYENVASILLWLAYNVWSFNGRTKIPKHLMEYRINWPPQKHCERTTKPLVLSFELPLQTIIGKICSNYQRLAIAFCLLPTSSSKKDGTYIYQTPWLLR